MMQNGNESAFNNYGQVAEIPFRVFEYLMNNTSQDAENLWKALRYDDINPLRHKNLTLKEKRSLIWDGSPEEDYRFRVFNKPLIVDDLADNTSTTPSPIQFRMFRYGLIPSTQLSGAILFEIDTYSGDKVAYMRNENNIPVERTDYLESKLLTLLNGVDIGFGYDFLQFNKEVSRTSQSLLSINNGKLFYGRAMVLGLRWSVPQSDGNCE